MEPQTIQIRPFHDRAAVKLNITGAINRQSHLLGVVFRLQGDLKAIAIPPPAKLPARRHQLWENTCLECFVAAESSQAYWEFNLSPTGDWNAYRFDGYRRGMREEKAIPELIVDIQRTPSRLCLGCMLDIVGLGLDRQTLVMGFAAVIRSGDGRNTYWAAAHPGPKPDFHRREAFILKAAP